MTMNHMSTKWVAQIQLDGTFAVTTHEATPWYIATVGQSIGEDATGEETAHAICREHNASLTAKAKERSER